MAEREQNYQNHVRWLPPLHFFVLPVLLLYVLNAGRHLWLDPTRSTAFALVVAVALLMFAVLARIQAITVQDRVIRLEMRLRLKQVLPADLQARAVGLTPQQLVALRFSGDDELPALVGDVLDGKLASQKAIKQAIKHWQADWLRA
jgi:hypothetical protein